MTAVQGSLLAVTGALWWSNVRQLSAAHTGPLYRNLNVFLSAMMLSSSVVIDFLVVISILSFCIQSSMKVDPFLTVDVYQTDVSCFKRVK